MDKKEFLNKWLENFASSVARKDIRLKVENQYIWHIFSFDLLPKETYLEDDKAQEAYNKAEKSDAIMFQLWESENAELLPEKFNNADEVNKNMEIYVVGKNFSWSYIVTHEDGFGPYFITNQKERN